nr:type II toxin-antitoxin system RelE/ParE family toxin [Leisingera thetidis]
MVISGVICSRSAWQGKVAENQGGYRTILGFRKTNSDRIFFLYGYPKNARSNINSKEHKALAMLAADLIKTTDEQVEALKAKGTIAELECKK